MNGKQGKKIRKEINSASKELVNQLFEVFNGYPLKRRISMAIKIIFRRL